MKSIKIIFGIVIVSLITLNLQSCNNTQDVNTESETIQIEDESQVYACPMHPEIMGKKSEQCSICGMDLTDLVEEDHSGHNH